MPLCFFLVIALFSLRNYSFSYILLRVVKHECHLVIFATVMEQMAVNDKCPIIVTLCIDNGLQMKYYMAVLNIM